MKFLLLFLFVLGPGSLLAQVPWKAHAGVGLSFAGGPSSGPEPFVEASAFLRVLEPPPPEYFQAGLRLAWDPRGVTASVGVRHKVYGLAWASSGQEVLVGRRLSSAGDSWCLSGRFGLGLPWDGGDGGLPSTDLDLVWGVDWSPDGAVARSSWGLALGLGAGQPAGPP